MPPFHLSIKFKKSRSADFDFVIDMCKEFDHFKKEDLYYILEIHSITEIFEKWDHFSGIHYKIRSWKGIEIKINGKLSFANHLDIWIGRMKICYVDNYLKTQDQRLHCDCSEWGCYRLESVRRFIDNPEYGSNVYWFRYGRFTGDSTWSIDKKKILDVLTDEAKKKLLYHCPVFNEYKITSLLLRLPDSIFIDGIKWVKKYRTEETANGTVKIAYNIDIASADSSNMGGVEFLNEWPKMDEIDLDSLTDRQINELIEAKRKPSQ